MPANICRQKGQVSELTGASSKLIQLKDFSEPVILRLNPRIGADLNYSICCLAINPVNSCNRNSDPIMPVQLWQSMQVACLIKLPDPEGVRNYLTYLTIDCNA